MLSVGADRSARTNEGASALLEAAREGQIAVCKWLLESGLARVTERDDNEKSVLMVAASAGHTELCTYLLQAGALPLDRARDGKTVMHFAAYVFMAIHCAN